VKTRGGFTLLELLVAITVFAVIAAAAYTGLDSATATEMKIDEEGLKWKNMTFFFAHLERDLSCFVDRPVTGQSGEKLRSMTGSAGDTSGMNVELAFTRLAREGESAAPKRVGYRLFDGKIEVLVWPALDLAPGSIPEVYEAMSGVGSFNAKFGESGSWSQNWENDAPPRGVEVTVALKSGETVRRIFALR
jgi:general secretion pathway protein J